MALTLQQLEDHVEMVWGSEYDPRLSMADVVNEAGRYLFNMHSWNWRQRPPATVSFVANQEYVTLPSDFGFGEIVSFELNDAMVFNSQPATLSDIQKWRASSIQLIPHLYYWALAYPAQSTTGDAPGTARLELYPTPSDSEANAGTVVYLSGWAELSSGSDAANIPSSMNALLVDLVRAFAASEAIALPRPRDSYPTLDDIERSALLRNLKRADGASQSEIGDIQGGMLQHKGGVDPEWNFDTSGLA